MKKCKVILIIISVVCILIGAAMVTGAYYSLVNKASDQLAALEFQEKTHTITEPFTNLHIHTVNSSVEILPSTDGITRIICNDSEKLYHSFSLAESAQGTQLNICQHDDWKWYEMRDMFYLQDDVTLRIYLPETEYAQFHVNSASGDITVAPDFRFQTFTTYTSSGNTKLTDLDAGHLTVQSVSGDLLLQNLEATEDVYLESISGLTQIGNLKAPNITTHSSSGDLIAETIFANTLQSTSVSGSIQLSNGSIRDTSVFETGSGEILIADCECGAQDIETVSGSVSLKNTCGTSLSIHTSSGDLQIQQARYHGSLFCRTISGAIAFTQLDAETLEFLTNSGDISGDLLSPKNFIANAPSGYLAVPPSDEQAGICQIHTASGNIHIVIEP